MGTKAAGKRVSEKKAMPVVRSVTGVISAATPQPNFLSMKRPARGHRETDTESKKEGSNIKEARSIVSVSQ